MKQLNEITVNWMLIGYLRYALNRDNKLAFYNFKIVVFEAIDYMKDTKYRNYTIRKVVDEIKSELIWDKKKDEELWLALVQDLEKLVVEEPVWEPCEGEVL